jgi:hypothetical protein
MRFGRPPVRGIDRRSMGVRGAGGELVESGGHQVGGPGDLVEFGDELGGVGVAAAELLLELEDPPADDRQRRTEFVQHVDDEEAIGRLVGVGGLGQAGQLHAFGPPKVIPLRGMFVRWIG